MPAFRFYFLIGMMNLSLYSLWHDGISCRQKAFLVSSGEGFFFKHWGEIHSRLHIIFMTAAVIYRITLLFFFQTEDNTFISKISNLWSIILPLDFNVRSKSPLAEKYPSRADPTNEDDICDRPVDGYELKINHFVNEIFLLYLSVNLSKGTVLKRTRDLERMKDVMIYLTKSDRPKAYTR